MLEWSCRKFTFTVVALQRSHLMILHTGNLKAEIAGNSCSFTGESWTCPDAALQARLNAATETAPKHHHSIKSLADHVLLKTGLRDSAEILNWQTGTLDEHLPEGAID
jgi:hypothetical protein